MAKSGSRLTALLSFVFITGNLLNLAHGGCSCNSREVSMTSKTHIGKSKHIHCCIDHVLRFPDNNATVSWTFEGKPISLTKDNKKISTCGQVLSLMQPKLSDAGIYTCVVTSSNGTSRSHNISLTVHEKPHKQPPANVKIQPETLCVEVGQPATFTCTGNYATRVEWYYFTKEGERKYLSLSKVDKNEYGLFNVTTEFSAVSEDHFGPIRCEAVNLYNRTTKIATLKDLSVSPDCPGRMIPVWTVIVAASCAFFFLAIPCLCFRFRTALRVMYMEATRGNHIKGGFLRDVFIVHGKEVTLWVHDVLVSTLEKTYGYRCYLPDRDMLGGEQYAEAIAQKMSMCRRVLVVITPCLLQSQWAYWSAHHGIATCFKSSRIRGLLLKEMGSDASSSETALFLKTLKPIELLKVPKRCQLREEKGERRDEKSKSSKSQSLNNITGSDDASRENLNEEEDHLWEEDHLNDQRNGPAYPFGDREEPKEQEYLCSNTYGSKISHTSEEKDLLCTSDMECLRKIFIGNPETLFWQRVRLFLDPPAAECENSDNSIV